MTSVREIYWCSSNSGVLKRIWINVFNSLNWQNLQLIKFSKERSRKFLKLAVDSKKSGHSNLIGHAYA